MQIELGTRVVRGIDWIWGEQDGEEGTLGTVIQIRSDAASNSSVKVLWDHGGQGIYRSGENNACDLLVFCSPAVSKHGVGCDVCLKDVIGTRWCCKECPLTNLCTTCYMNDKHSIQHAFERFDSSDNNGSKLPPRARCTKVEAKGFFPGAMVVRGLCWEWDDQDGGDGQIGKVTEIQEFHSKYRRNVARVQWISNGVSNVYRIGHNGKVDLKCIQPVPGGSYYKDHLPFLGEKNESISVASQPASIVRTAALMPNFPMDGDFNSGCNAGANAAIGGAIASVETIPNTMSFNYADGKSSIESNSSLPESASLVGQLGASAIGSRYQNVAKQFQINDRVRIFATKENCIALQAGHGGWNAKMESDIGKIGVVDAITENGDVGILMEENDAKWIVNAQILEKIVAPKLLKDGDSIRILANVNIAKRLYVSKVGEWTDEVGSCLGQVGKITKAFLDGNLRVVFGKSSIVIPSEFVVEKIQQITTAEAVTEVSEVCKEARIVEAAKAGDLQELKDILDTSTQMVNTPSLESTPLTAAIFEEREDVVDYLLKKGADVNILDKSKHTALHHALSVGNEDIIDLVISDKRLDTTILAGKTNLDYLQYSAVCGSILGTKYLLQNTPIRMARTGSGPSPVHFAVFSKVELINYLIKEAGFDVNSRDLDQRTPLHIAILTNNLSAALFLVDNGADVNASDIRGNTSLHMTLSMQERVSLREHPWYTLPIKRFIGKKDQQRTENKETINRLINDLDMKKTWYANDAVISCFLIKNGADVNMKNSNGCTPFSACSRTEVLSVVKKFYERMHRPQLSQSDVPKGNRQADMFSSLSSDGSCGYQECRLCRENNADGTFEPCGHSVVCLDCASYFCKCFMCEKEVISFTKRSTVMECLVCDDKLAEVIFEPCKHVVTCPTCAWRMAKCIFCKMEIKMKFDKNLQPLSAPTDADNVKYDDLLSSLKSLEAKVKEIESVNTCTICLDRQRNVMFLCGHGTCDICSPTLELCPICRDPIEKKIPVF